MFLTGSYLLHNTGMSDLVVGVVLLVMSLCMLCSCLVLMVKLLHSILRGQIASVIKKTVNADFPEPFSFLTGYFAILVGAGMTILVQSSSVFTSAITPLVGIGVVALDRMYPLTLGSNIGTTVTGLLAALASSGGKLQSALQIALCHLLFNVSGIILFYPVPATRQLPIGLAKILGNTTAKYRWFAILYLLVMFLLLPGVLFALSLAGNVALMATGIPLSLLLLFIIAVNILQRKAPSFLPQFLHTWDAFPEWTHSFDPWDRLLSHCACCSKVTQQSQTPAPDLRRNDASSRHLLDGSASSSACSSQSSSRYPSRNSSHANLSYNLTLTSIDKITSL